MEDLIKYIIEKITGSKEFTIQKNEVQEGYWEYTVTLPQEMVGMVIGKGGKTINALRQLVKVRATLEKIHVHLNIETPEK